MKKCQLILLALIGGLLMAACRPSHIARSESQSNAPATSSESQQQESYDIITVLPPDAISSIDNPRFYEVAQADTEYEPGETVIGLDIAGEARAYSTALLSSHEIVNDEIKGRPIAVTW